MKKSTNFLFRGKHCQVFGIIMGLPVSAIIANLVMEDAEQQALSSSAIKPSFSKRYDDVILEMKKHEIPHLLAHVNSIEPSIDFTVGHESDSAITFLDTLVKHNSDGTLGTEVYCKKTHTDKYLDFNSHYLIAHIRAVGKTLLQWANVIPNTNESKHKETQQVFNALKNNNYPQKFLENLSNENSSVNNANNKTEPSSFAVIPYVKGTLEPVKRILGKYN